MLHRRWRCTQRSRLPSLLLAAHQLSASSLLQSSSHWHLLRHQTLLSWMLRGLRLCLGRHQTLSSQMLRGLCPRPGTHRRVLSQLLRGLQQWPGRHQTLLSQRLRGLRQWPGRHCQPAACKDSGRTQTGGGSTAAAASSPVRLRGVGRSPAGRHLANPAGREMGAWSGLGTDWRGQMSWTKRGETACLASVLCRAI